MFFRRIETPPEVEDPARRGNLLMNEADCFVSLIYRYFITSTNVPVKSTLFLRKNTHY